MQLLGWGIVLVALLGGFMMAGGRPASLFVLAEYTVICGISLGYLVGSSPKPLLMETFARIMKAVKGAAYTQKDFTDLISVLYEVLLIAREKGIVGIEEHVTAPEQSSIFQKYPSVTHRHEVLEFIQEAFKPIIAGKVKAEQLQDILQRKLDRAQHHSHLPVMLISKTGDAMPGVGIVAAVLGIIVTMSHLGGPKEEIGIKVAHALVGTFLGILLSYGFVQPLATRVELMGEEDIDYLRVAAAIVVAYASGAAPIVAADAGREFIPHDRAIDADELEKMLKALTKR